MLIGVGCVLVQPTIAAYAASSSTISAVVSGPVPTTPATIDSPLEGQTVSSLPVTISGTCPSGSSLQLFRNTFPSGTSVCNGGAYSIQTDLFDGKNSLVVYDYNFAGQAGPPSTTRTVTYVPKVVAPPPISHSGDENSQSTSNGSNRTQSNPKATVSQPPLTLNNLSPFHGFSIGQTATWSVAIAGGTAPYSVSVVWGDGTDALYTSTNADTLTLTHIYTTVGPENGSYQIVVNASDAANNHTSLQIAGLITSLPVSSGASGGGGTLGTKAPAPGIFGYTLTQAITAVWVTLGGTAGVVGSFWVGEIYHAKLLGTRFGIKKP